MPGSKGNHLVTLPPSVRFLAAAGDGAATSAGGKNNPGFGCVAHKLVNPAGCHALLLALNGEAYYLHLTSERARKLNKF